MITHAMVGFPHTSGWEPPSGSGHTHGAVMGYLRELLGMPESSFQGCNSGGTFVIPPA